MRQQKSLPPKAPARTDSGTFIDLFSGCGGLALGLLLAGWRGQFAIESNATAFGTLNHNLVNSDSHNRGLRKIEWPSWLDKSPHEIQRFIRRHRQELEDLSGKIQLISGGPPCQGFSSVGRREASDLRNKLFRAHVKVVEIIGPDVVLLENVPGIQVDFVDHDERGNVSKKRNFAEKIQAALRKIGYVTQQSVIRAADYGVPQLRPRWIMVGFRNDRFPGGQAPDFFKILQETRETFLMRHGLPVDRCVTVAEAISDMRVRLNGLTECTDSESPPGYHEIAYQKPQSEYQKLMHGFLNGHAVNSLRVPNHRPETVNKFKKILATCRRGVSLSREDRERLGIRKFATTPLAFDMPSFTITTAPDDLLHYEEPRIHTVREFARLQSFPDWFEFRGKYTSGGRQRRRDCPRYTQVGNAVPPLFAMAMGEALALCVSRGVTQPRTRFNPEREFGTVS